MAKFTATSLNGRTPNMVREFVVDEVDDLESIDTRQLSPGCKAFVINQNQWYMLNHNKEWIPVKIGGGGGGGGGIHVIYDGGDLDDPQDNIVYDGGDIDYDGGEP